jgi:hypothetical protein
LTEEKKQRICFEKEIIKLRLGKHKKSIELRKKVQEKQNLLARLAEQSKLNPGNVWDRNVTFDYAGNEIEICPDK